MQPPGLGDFRRLGLWRSFFVNFVNCEVFFMPVGAGSFEVSVISFALLVWHYLCGAFLS